MPGPTFKKIATLPFFAAFVAGAASADESLIAHINNHLEGSIGAEHLSYSEINTQKNGALPYGADLDTETGTILASSLAASWQGRLWVIDGLRASLEGHLANGTATYNGYLQDLQTGALTPQQIGDNEIFTDLQLKAGKGFAILPGGRDLLTPYAGVGLTAWHRDLSGPGGYTEQYRHDFWKVGGQYQIEVVNKLIVSIDASYGRTFNPRMNASILPVTFDLGVSAMQSYTLGLRYAVSPESYVGLDTYWTHYTYGRSPMYDVNIDGGVYQVYEPHSTTTRDGVMLAFGWAYR